jgi:hypothetical protein
MSAALSCRLDATPAPDGIVQIALTLTNTGDRPASVELSEPFVAFSLRAWVAGEEVVVAIPPTSLQLHVVPRVLEPGEDHLLPIPVYLRFDPDALYGAGEDMFCWRLASEPGPLELEATIAIEGVAIEPCRARVEPLA